MLMYFINTNMFCDWIQWEVLLFCLDWDNDLRGGYRNQANILYYYAFLFVLEN